MNAESRKKLRDELIRDEGMRLDAYRDSVGLWTIGVGHLLGDSMRMEKITPNEMHALLNADIAAAERVVEHMFPDWETHFDEVRQRALINMAFNLGNRLLQFQKFRALLQINNYTSASIEMLNSKWATQVGARSKRLSEMIAKENEYDNRV